MLGDDDFFDGGGGQKMLLQLDSLQPLDDQTLNNEILGERNREIETITNDLRDLNSIVQEFGIELHKQGEKLGIESVPNSFQIK